MQRGLWSVLGALLLTASAGLDGADLGAIGGVVRDESGGVLPGVTVSLVAEGAGGAPGTQFTDGGGAFRFDGLPPGNYRLVSRSPGSRRSRS